MAPALATSFALIPSSVAILFYTQGFFIGPMTAAFGWSRSAFMWPVTMAMIGLAILYPVAGYLGDRFGVRRVLVPLIILFGLGTMGLSLIGDNFVLYSAATILVGMAGVVQSPLLYSKVIAARAPLQSRGTLIAIGASGVSIGNALLPPIVVWLIAEFGWRGGRIGLGGMVLICALPVALFFMNESRTVIQAKTIRNLNAPSSPIQRKPAVLLLAALFLSGVALNGYLANLVPILADRGVGADQAAKSLSMVALAGAVGRIASGWLLDRVQHPAIGILWFLFGCAGVSLSLFSPNIFLEIIASISLGLSLGAEVELAAYYVARYFDYRRFGRALGFLAASYSIGSAIGSQFFNLARDLFGNYHSATLLSAILVLVSAGLVAWLPPYPTRVGSEARGVGLDSER
ncbi:MFS transporter [Sphingobium sp. TA15]|uniref:MFS transporter n=1 Tax=Sphingobium TaxID=165695 RepID=UPI00059D0E76|nr:MFS transporter [Sphingobium indicum]BDD65535.1 MFS transporter [Sphingobium sp. TA15]